MEYKLFGVYEGHSEDVRVVCSTQSGAIATGSRDQTVHVWYPQQDHIKDSKILAGHGNYVVALANVSSSTNGHESQELLVSGSRDKSVRLWDVQSGSCIQTMTGHTEQVNGVTILSDMKHVASAALDKTARVWRLSDGACVATLTGHDAAVLCITALADNAFVTGSGDTTLRTWQPSGDGSTWFAGLVYKGHADSVRCVAKDAGEGVIVSGSHDCTIKSWDNNAKVMTEFIGHTALVYSVHCTQAGLIVSGSEDNTCRIWQPAGECIQTIAHPGCVWSVSSAPTGHIITACSDHIARLWSADPNSVASPEIIEAFEAAVTAYKAQGSGGAGGGGGGKGGLPPNLKIAEKYELNMPGARDGDTKVVRQGGILMAYCWSNAQSKWEEIGQVVDEPGEVSTGKKMYRGKEWDHVFEVNVSDDEPTRKLACNRGEDPQAVALRFLDEEGLPLGYQQQVAQFIIQNTDSVSINADPLTGGSSYNPPAFPHLSDSAPHGKSAPIPALDLVIYEKPPPLDNLKNKVLELYVQHVRSEGVDQEFATQLDQLLKHVSSKSAQVSDQDIQLCLSILQSMLAWPDTIQYPAVDIVRVLLLNQSFAKVLGANTQFDCVQVGKSGLQRTNSSADIMTSAKMLCNMCRHEETRQQLVSGLEGVVECIADLSGGEGLGKKGARGAVGALMLNVAILCNSGSGKESDMGQLEGVQVQGLSALTDIIDKYDAEQDADSLAQISAAVGTIVVHYKDASSMCKDLGLYAKLAALADKSNAPVLQSTVAKLGTLLK